MANATPIVYVVDDDADVRNALSSLLRSVGLEVQTFSESQEFLRAKRENAPECLLLDIRMPGMSGVDLQELLIRSGVFIPIVFITGHGDIPMAVRAIKSGAIEFLSKPFREQDLLDSVHQAIERSSTFRKHNAVLNELRTRLRSLTPRETEVMKKVVKGLLNKQIAADLGTSEKTVKFHRGQVMRKMKAQSLPDLVRMAQRLHDGIRSSLDRRG
jgi:FixJ family two-component response regulator